MKLVLYDFFVVLIALVSQYPCKSGKVTKLTAKWQNEGKMIPKIERMSGIKLERIKVKQAKNVFGRY